MSPVQKNWTIPDHFPRLAGLNPEAWVQILEKESGLKMEGVLPRVEDGASALNMLAKPLLPRALGAEIWAVARGIKPAGRAILHRPEDLQKMRNFCRQQGLQVLESEIPVRVSFLVVGDQQDHRGGILFFYGRDPDLLMELFRLDKVILNAQSKEETLEACRLHGEFLGYPKCCVKAFIEEVGAGENRAIKEIWHRKDLGKGWWPLNVLNQIGPVLLGYYPCSLKCQESLHFSQKVMNLEEVKRVMVDSRFSRALSGVFYYWLDRLQFWHPTGRPDLAVHCQMLADGFSSLPYCDPVDFLFSAAVIAPFNRSETQRIEGGALVLEFNHGELKIGHPTMPILRFEMEQVPAIGLCEG